MKVKKEWCEILFINSCYSKICKHIPISPFIRCLNQKQIHRDQTSHNTTHAFSLHNTIFPKFSLNPHQGRSFHCMLSFAPCKQDKKQLLCQYSQGQLCCYPRYNSGCLFCLQLLHLIEKADWVSELY